jgi:DHA2 family multidrug resistance protein
MAGPGAAAAGDEHWTPVRSVAGDRNPWSIVAVISIATFMTTLDIAIVNVALEHIAGGMSIDYDQATWVTTTFLIASAIVIPISGWLADVIGRKRYYMISVAVFTVASLCCGLAQNLPELVLARVIQGIGGGGLAAVEQSMLVDTFPPRQRGLAFAAYAIVVIVGPIFGPIFGGWITDTSSWRWCFLINIPVGMLSLFLVNLYVDEPAAMKRDREELWKGGLKVDWLGFLLVALFLGCLEITLDRGQLDDWFSSPVIIATAIVTVVSLALFIPWELSRAKPIVPIRMFARRNFGMASIFLLITGMILFGTTLFIPQLLQQVLGYTAMDAGMALSAGGVATIFVMPIVGVLSGRADARLLIGFAFILQALALLYMTHLDINMSFADAAKARLFQSIGLPFLFVPITALAYVGLRPNESNQASALMNVMRNLGGTIGIAGVQIMLARRQQFHQARLVEALNPLNPSYTHYVAQATQALGGRGQPPLQASAQVMGLLYQSVQRQAAMMSFLDVFHSLMIVILCAMPLLLFMRSKKAGGGAPAAAAA